MTLYVYIFFKDKLLVHASLNMWHHNWPIKPPLLTVTMNEISPILWTTHRLKPEQIQDVDAISHDILWLDMIKATMLNEIVNERMGVLLNIKQIWQLKWNHELVDASITDPYGINGTPDCWRCDIL